MKLFSLVSVSAARARSNVRRPMTDASAQKATPFNYGSGHVRPNGAMDPGLVYDLTATDYLNFLCALGYNSTQVRTFSSKPFVCPSNPIRIEDLNYPSISVPYFHEWASVTRTVKNVGPPGTYKLRIKQPPGVEVSVIPSELEFSKVGEEKTFEVTLKAVKEVRVGYYVFGGLIWSDGTRYVRSPIVVGSGQKSV